MCNITVESDSLALFEKNQALFGGAIIIERKYIFIIDGCPVVVFKLIKHLIVELYT